MKRLAFIVFGSTFFFTFVFSQTASVQWNLTVDTSTVSTGSVQSRSETFSNMVVRSYNGGVCQKSGPDAGGNWVAETAQNNTRYVQFAASPLAGYSFTVTSISFTIGWAGTTDHVFANVYYSTDSSFTTKIQLGSTITLQNSSGVLTSFSVNVPVNDGNVIYVRFYPWDNTTASGKSLGLVGLVIAGTATAVGSPSLIVAPASISFRTIKVNTVKDLSFAVSGAALSPASDSIRFMCPSGFGVSTTSGTGYSAYLALPYSVSTLMMDTIYVRFMPSLVQPYNGNIMISGGGITPQSVAVTGNSVSTSAILGIFVSPSGNDADSGNYSKPFLTIQKAVSVAQPGDTIFLRAGTYANSTTINLSQSGSAGNLMCLYVYPPDQALPVLDFSAMSFGSTNRGINLAGNYWHIKGLDIYRAGDNGMFTSGSNNIVELCVFRENRDGGCQVGGGASYNRFINCDSYFNYDDTGDTNTTGGNADGFSPKLDVGTGNYFYGCRAWQNSDDGWDGYLRPSDDVSTTIENCWSFMNGFLKDGVTTHPSMNGNGFKMGGSDSKNLRHNMIVINCLAFLNKAKGFDQNNNLGSMTILNCTSYHNGIGTIGGAYNFSVPLALSAGKVLIVENCISHSPTKSPGYTFGTQVSPVFATDSWMSPFAAPTDSDFIAIDTTGVRSPRKPDGTLPEITFMHLALGSQFIDAGTDVGLPYHGTKPDLGCFETIGPADVLDNKSSRIAGFQLSQNYPNPFNPTTEINFQIPAASRVKLVVYDILGREVVVLVDRVEAPGSYTVRWNARAMPSGIYFYRFVTSGFSLVRKMALVK